jgi:hypothetical protein
LEFEKDRIRKEGFDESNPSRSFNPFLRFGHLVIGAYLEFGALLSL